jgi:hypothetical protein
MAAETFHSPTPEEIMEYVDGEGTPAARAGIEAHLATCPSCQALAAGQRVLSRDVAAWNVAPAPDSLRAPQPPAPVLKRPWWHVNRLAFAGVSVAAVVVVVSLFLTQFGGRMMQPKMGPAVARASYDANKPILRQAGAEHGDGPIQGKTQDNRPAFVASEGQVQVHADPAPSSPEPASVAHGPAVIRTATLQLVAKDFNGVRSAVEVILDSNSGFADQLGLSADPGSIRVLHGTLRVPGTRLTEVLTRLRALGQVTQDQQNAQDVADQLVDLDARLKSARATEQRLIDLLKNRTGKLSDVLEVEQELTRVRLDIERLDAEKTNMSRRVAYATVDLTISEEHKTATVGPLPLWTQLRVAAVDGLENVVDTLLGLALFALRAGPSLALWGGAAVMIWLTVRRARRSVSLNSTTPQLPTPN